MKKHPVDDLFARKLDDWQPKPSPDLWKRIEKRQEDKVRHLTAWYGYAAASVVLMLIAGYLGWQNQSKVFTSTKGELASVDQIHRPKENTSDIAGTSHSISRLHASVKVKKDESKEIPEKMRLPDPKMQPVAKMRLADQPQVQELDPALDRIEVTAIQKIETSPESMIPESKPKTSLRSPDVRPEITNKSLGDEALGRVIIAHIEMDDVIQEDQKASKLIRILRQLKNAKQGEAVQWDELGFNPKKIMARADERLRNEEEKVSKKYQELKDKTKL